MDLSTGDTRLIVETCLKHGLLRNQAAYVLATVHHETGGRMKPINENLNYSATRLRQVFPKYFSAAEAKAYAGKPERIANRAYANRLGNGPEKSGDGWRYRGRGYVQITGRTNYRKFGIEDAPENALKPGVAANVLVEGMKVGKFTGKKLADFISDDRTNFESARQIVNAMDRATDIAEYADEYARLLRAARYAENAAPVPAPAASPEPVSGPLKIDAILHRGSRGDFVAELQDNLNALGFGPVNVDGDFGYATERAVKAFQTANGLKADGWAGPRTLEAIGKTIKDRETKPKLDAAASVVDDAAGKGVSKTEVITTVTGIGGVATVVKETADSVRDGATSLMSLGPWILLAFVIAAGAGYVIWERRRKRLAAKAVQEVL